MPTVRKRKYAKYPSIDFITRTEAAKLLGVHPATVTRLERRGLFPTSIRLGRGVLRYERRAVERFLATGCKAENRP
jgi:predicted DNA-binding transcriptional regulator AlpA